MRRSLKWVIGVVVAVILLVAGALAAVPFLVDTPRMQAWVAATAAQALGRPVKFSALSVRILPLPALQLRDLEVAEDPKFGPGPFIKLDTGHIRLQLLPLLTGRVELGDVVLKKPVVTIVQAPDGRLNIATLGATPEPRTAGRPSRGGGGGPGGGAAALAAKITLDDGVVVYSARGPGDRVTQYRLEGLDLTLAGGGPQITFKADARLQPGALALKVSDGLASLANARALTDAPLRATLAIDGKDIKDLMAVAGGPSPTLGGGIKGTLALGGTLGVPTAAGEVQLSNLTATQTTPRCPEPKTRTLTIPTVKLNVGWQQPRLTGKPVTAKLGDGTITTQLTATLDRGVRVQLADLGIKALPLEKVLVDYLCQGYAVTGPLDLTGTLAFETGDLWHTLSGPGQFRIGSGKVVGPQALALFGNVVRLGGALSSAPSADVPRMSDSPLEFDSITGTYVLTNGVATTRDLLYTSRAMKVAVAGEYGLATGSMNLDMVATLRQGELRAKVTGTAASPSIRVAPSSILKGIDPGKTEKGLQDLLKRFKKN